MQDTLTGTLHYAGERVALGTMVYKNERACGDLDQCEEALEKTQCHLKLIPCVRAILRSSKWSPVIFRFG